MMMGCCLVIKDYMNYQTRLGDKNGKHCWVLQLFHLQACLV